MAAVNQSVAKRVQAVIQRAIEQKRIVGSVVLVAHGGELICAETGGDADREWRKPMRRTTQFRLASVSKPFITLAAMRLLEQGKLQLDDTVSRWLPWFTPALADGRIPPITLRQLLTHSAGLDYRFKQRPSQPYHRLGIQDGLERASGTLQQNLRRLADAPLIAEPGSRFNYSLSIDVLGAVLEQVAERPLPQLFDHLVAQPLGLCATGFGSATPDNLATAYYNGATRPEPMYDGLQLTLPPEFGYQIDFAPTRALDVDAYPSGGAGMVGSADDVLKLLEAMRGGANGYLRPETVALMHQPHVSAAAETQGPGWGFGFGGALLLDATLAATPQCNGTLQWGGAYGHSWFCDRQSALSVVALTNTAYEGMSGVFPGEIRDAVYRA
ncbi:TPA: beta-lactamase family protein [Serratia odorifera]|nr:beta-lactamase family protein [Serratia odorifera]